MSSDASLSAASNDGLDTALPVPPLTLAADEMVLWIDLQHPVPAWLYQPDQRVGLMGMVGSGNDSYARHLTDAGRLLWLGQVASEEATYERSAAIVALPDNPGVIRPTPYAKVLAWSLQEDASFDLIFVPDSVSYPPPEPDNTGFSVRDLLAPIEKIEEDR